MGCSADLAAITGQKSMTRGQAVKAVWVYIKKKGLNNGRNVKAVGKIFGGGSMFKLAGAIQKHLNECASRVVLDLLPLVIERLPRPEVTYARVASAEIVSRTCAWRAAQRRSAVASFSLFAVPRHSTVLRWTRKK